MSDAYSDFKKRLEEVGAKLTPQLIELYEGLDLGNDKLSEYCALYTLIAFATFFMTRHLGLELTRNCMDELKTRLESALDDGPIDPINPPRFVH